MILIKKIKSLVVFKKKKLNDNTFLSKLGKDLILNFKFTPNLKLNN